MKIVFFGDSITDMSRERETDGTPRSLGSGFVRIVADSLMQEAGRYEIINRGISGERSVDLYARIGRDVWQYKPDVLSILVGINDIWHEKYNNGVDIARYKKTVSAMVEETKERLPQTRIILCEPFVLHGSESDAFGFERLDKIRDYAVAVKEIADRYGAAFVPLQEDLQKAVGRYDVKEILYDGIHPNVVGAGIIARKWLDIFNKE